MLQPPIKPLLQVDGVTLQYETGRQLVRAAYRVSFNVLQSDRFVILGPSGCGKSTLLKSVGGGATVRRRKGLLKRIACRG